MVTETIEVQNDTIVPVLVSAYRSKFSKRLYVHLGKAHGDEIQILSGDYSLVEVKETQF